MKRQIAMNVLVMLLYASTCSAQSTYQFSRYFHFTGAALDLSTTLTAERNPNLQEANPVLGQNPVRQVVLMGGATFILDRLNHYSYRKHPKIATTMNFIAGSLHIAAGTSNIHTMRSH